MNDRHPRNVVAREDEAFITSALTVHRMTRELMVEPGVALISIAAAPVHPMAWEFSFLLIPIIMALLGRASKRQLSSAVAPRVEAK